ncbi:MAG: dTDP-4-dehydrorhamnose 3,5-epimerase [Proteobacteria bacterium]|jgi:dTDP-4-dehydrorhamnose 3,5-epimerase|nr:dTDP-4-dehydrorhamnose 3,5-epimerase [Desulfocapsa sp.]MBU3946098.1 dTDP-4-dehydrorhamnose 3,5-epimerase [Pseudomonadota bacterium]MCG2744746.1 dTDP-4-dehydrorhamnose 3,5-epimerase [Desulfobacteraceae bacterium]MBU3982317.1 dTDP-4-dehydrorhamnose 3,5-epimerase [Pseudomonadota bacterium]MBU4028358.1 dTDP-4-dehydrorhamnose 3,5-epimerase [Pseudomonadota bacterium]
MKVIETPLAGLLIIEPKVFGDERGFFLETWSRKRYQDIGINIDFVQDNLSFSGRGVLRGLHFQNPQPQGKLVYVLQGEVFDVVVDIRKGSPTFGRWHGVVLSGENKRQFWVPPGFAHGFCVTSDTALFAYKCTELYAPQHEKSIRWDDPALAIDWPINEPQVSDKDRLAPMLADIDPASFCLFENK